MKALKLLLLIGSSLMVFGLAAQPSGGAAAAPNDYKALVQQLNREQQQNLEDYLRHMTGDLEMEPRYLFERLTLDQRGRTIQFAYMMQSDFSKLERTTVRWQPDTLTINEIEEQTLVLDSFQITNTGIHPYLIREVKTYCDCTVLRYPKYPIMPGETASIRIEFDSKNKVGRTTPGIIIYDNSAPNRRNIVYLDAIVTPRKKIKTILTGGQ
jgi:hypothetical protein